MGLDLVEFVMAVEERFDIEIPDTEASELVTPRLVMDCVERQVAKRGPVTLAPDRYPRRRDPRNWTRREIEEAVRDLLREEPGINKFNDDDKFVDDLNVD